MATSPEVDFFEEGKPCMSLNDCDGNHQFSQAPSIQATRRQQLYQDSSEMKETEELLAAEMNKLSVQERSKALDDVHCVGEELEETTEMIEDALGKFDQLVQTTTSRIYDIALKQNRSYVEDRSFRQYHRFDLLLFGPTDQTTTSRIYDIDELFTAKSSVLWRRKGCL